MRTTIFFFTLALCLRAAAQNGGRIPATVGDTAQQTQDFYDDAATYPLPVESLVVEGEIENPGPVDFANLVKRSVTVKEALLNDDGSNRFTGAYRYDGYSLYDILSGVKLKKKNAAEFRPIIDLYVEVTNRAGEKVILSWGEIYYPNTPHRILIASDVARIVPSKTKDLWPLPAGSKLVVANDLLSERNIMFPVSIRVCSYSRSFPTDEKHEKMHSPGIHIYAGGEEIKYLDKVQEGLNSLMFNTIFYGRGRGIHSTTPFEGPLLKEVLKPVIKTDRKQLMGGYLGVAAADGYRMVISFSELFNRNDQQEFLLLENRSGKEGGVFKIFPACDFFSDRAIKAVNSIYLETISE